MAGMKRAALVLFLVCAPLVSFAQIPGSGIQFGGVLSANVIDDFGTNTAYSDNNNGYTYLQLNGSFKDGPFGMESQVQFGPAPSTGGVNNLYVHYAYGYANLFDSALYLAVGRVVDLSTFGLVSYYQQGPNGPGVYGNGVGKIGSSGFGFDGVELRIVPTANLVLGVVVPYNINPFPIVNSTLKATKLTVSYTVPKLVQVVLGYQQHFVGVADYLQPPSPGPTDPNVLLGKNKAYVLANLLVAEELTAGVRYELDHDVSAREIISNNVYATLGGRIGNFSIGGDLGLYVPAAGSPGLEVLAATWYTFPSVLPSVDLQPCVQVGWFTSDYPMVSDLPGGTYTNGFNNNNYLTINPQLKLLLGRSQHELVLGYTVSYDLDTSQIILDQLNVMMQIYF